MKDATIEALNGVILVLRKTRMDNLGSLLEVDIKSASNEALASLFDTEDVSSTQCATVYSQSKTNAIAEKGLSISSKLLEVGRLAPLAIKAELPGTARKMSLIVMDLIKSTLETIYDRMKSNVDEAFIKAVTDEMKSYAMTSPSGEQASLETNQSTQESNETQIVGRFFAKFITGPFVSGRICLQGKDYIYETLGAGATQKTKIEIQLLGLGPVRVCPA